MVDRRSPLTRLALAAFLFGLTAFTVAPSAQQGPQEGFVPDELLVQFRSGVTEGQRGAVRAAHGVQTLKRYEQVRAERVRIPGNANPIALARALSVQPEVEAAQPNFIQQASSVGSPNDPFFVNGNMWGLAKISAPLAWSSFGAGADTVVVADIDTGVDYGHPELSANMWHNPGEIAGNGIDDDQNGYVDDVYGIDAANNDSNPIDDHGHGTHTSGTIGAVSDNGLGVAGVAKNVKILACKFLKANGTGLDSDATECFNYVIALKQRGVNIRVTSNSWGHLRGQGGIGTVLKNAIDAAGDVGIVNVFAAGNDGLNIDVTPADPASFTSPSIVSVAASDEGDARASFSNYGSVSVDLAAPGTNVLSTYPNGYAYASGTSMATPHVAGVAALLLAHQPSLTVAQVKGALLNSVDLVGLWTDVVATGGRLNAFATLNSSGGVGPLVNVAAAAMGGTATASSSYSSPYGPAGTNDGDRSGLNWGSGGGWNDATANTYPDWLQIDFSGSKTISELDVVTVQDAYWTPSAPTAAMTFTQYGVRAFEAQYWTGSAWQTIPGTTVTGNTLVWRHFAFTPITTSRIRIVVSQGVDGYSRITEVEAWGTSPGGGLNTPPTVTLTAPSEGAGFTAPTTVTLTATASDSDGISSVSFYANGNSIGTDTTSPYSVDWLNVQAGSYALTAVAADTLGGSTTSTTVNVTVTAPGGGGPLVNVAAAAAGGTATASSTYSPGYAPAGVNDGDRRGLNWGSGGGWNDATANTFPDWVQVDFSGSKTISEVDVFTLQDAYSAPSVPTATLTFTQWGLRDFEVQYWNGSAWQTVPGTTVTGNTLVWRHFTFAPIPTTRIRILVTQALASYSRITEVEAWGAPGGNPLVNVAAAAVGGTATASSSYSAAYAPAGANDGDRMGLNWGSGGGWNDATANTFPDWVQVDFSGSKIISEVDVFTLQDAYSAPSVPTATLTFTQWGLRDFEVQYWNGSAWQTVPGTAVTGNTLVWRHFTFAPITTTRIRILVTQALAGYSRLIEVEAWGTP